MKLHRYLKISFGVLALLLVAAVSFLVGRYPELEEEVKQEQQQNQEIIVSFPSKGQTITSPLQISGKAKGTWFFEASFPVSVLDEDGTVLGIAPMQAKGEWMTEDFVEFAGAITFSQPKGKKGTLLFEKDNPSGLPEFDKEFRLEINFNPLALSN